MALHCAGLHPALRANACHCEHLLKHPLNKHPPPTPPHPHPHTPHTHAHLLHAGGLYPHPRLVLYLLAPAFGAGDAARATFVRRNGALLLDTVGSKPCACQVASRPLPAAGAHSTAPPLPPLQPPAADESTAAAECRETLYSLVPAEAPGGGGGVDDLAGMLAGGLSLGERPRVRARVLA